MAPPACNGVAFVSGTKICCTRKDCKGFIPLGTLVHKYSVGKPPACRVCQQHGATRIYKIPDGADRNPNSYQRPAVKANRIPKADQTPKGEKDMPKETEKLKKQLALQEEKLKGLQKLLEENKVEVPPTAQPTEGKDLASLQKLQAELKEVGCPNPQLDAKVDEMFAQQEKDKNAPDLKAISGKLNAAKAKTNQCAEHYVKCQENLDTAKQKALQAFGEVDKLEKEKQELLEKEGYLREEALPFKAAPETLSDLHKAQYEQAINDFKKSQHDQQLLFQKQLDELATKLVADHANMQQATPQRPPATQGDQPSDEPVPPEAATATDEGMEEPEPTAEEKLLAETLAKLVASSPAKRTLEKTEGDAQEDESRCETTAAARKAFEERVQFCKTARKDANSDAR